MFEIIPFLLRKLGADDDNKPSLASVLQAQVVSEFYPSRYVSCNIESTGIEWTPQVNFGMVPTPWLDGSLLVLGTRAGYVTLLRYVLFKNLALDTLWIPTRYRNDCTMEYVQTQSVSDHWITRLAFDSWNIISPGHCNVNPPCFFLLL